ncbi:MAG: hypothetical protein ABS35_19175 [Kaistia sp. SCN 65-12]|nr:MAG: hypothetical protein ABS35_19175 [Kaistia sp. SCN 65-12]
MQNKCDADEICTSRRRLQGIHGRSGGDEAYAVDGLDRWSAEAGPGGRVLAAERAKLKQRNSGKIGLAQTGEREAVASRAGLPYMPSRPGEAITRLGGEQE